MNTLTISFSQHRRIPFISYTAPELTRAAQRFGLDADDLALPELIDRLACSLLGMGFMLTEDDDDDHLPLEAGMN